MARRKPAFKELNDQVLSFSSTIQKFLKYFMSKSMLRMSCKSTDYANARKVRHGDWRDDRPPQGRGGRASTDGLAACRRVNAMAPPPLYAYINTMVLSIVHSKRFQISENKKAINHVGLSLFIILRSLASYHVNHATQALGNDSCHTTRMRQWIT